MYSLHRSWPAIALAASSLLTSGCRSTGRTEFAGARDQHFGPVEQSPATSTATIPVTLASHSLNQPNSPAVAGESPSLDFDVADTRDSPVDIAVGSPAPAEETLAIAERLSPGAADTHRTAAEGQKLPIEAFIAMALASNPRIAALMHRRAALANRISQARALPDPLVQETFWPFNGNALETAGGRAANQLGVSQQVPWPDKLNAKAAIARREVQIADAELKQAKLDISEAVGLACIEIWFADEAIAVVDEFGELVAQLNQVSEAKYRSAASGAGQQDVLRAQIEGDRLEDRRVQLTRQKQVAQADLAALLHNPQLLHPEIEAPIEQTAPSTQLDQLIGLAESCNPALAGLAAEIARDRAKQKLACLQQYPDFQLGATWLIISDDDALSPVATGNDNVGFTIGMTLPVWRDKIRGGIAEAGHQTLSSANQLASQKDSIAGKLRRLVAQFDASAEQVRILEQRIIPRTEDALEISLADYAGNRTEFLSVIDLYEERLMLELQRLSIRRSQHGILIQLEALVGCGIEDFRYPR